MAEIKKISTEFQLLDKFLDTSGDAGTSGQVLSSTATGINWVSGGSLPGGPYLPLSAGGSFPLTGALNINLGSSNPSTLKLIRNTTGDSQIVGDIEFNTTAAQGTDDRIALIRAETQNGAGTSRGGQIKLYTRLSGSASFNTTTYDVFGNWALPGRLSVQGTGDSYFAGNVGIGTTSPQEKLDVEGNIVMDAADARLKIKSGITGTNGGVDWTFNTASTQYARIDLDYDTRASVGLLIDSGYPITLDFSSGRFAIQNNGSEKMRINSNGNVGIGVTNPTFGLTLSRNSDPSGLNSGVLLGLESSDLALSAGYRMKSEDTNSAAQYYQVLYDGDQIKWKNWNGSGYVEKMSLTNSGNLKAAGSIQMADDTATASATKVGTMRYRTGTEYVEVDGVELVTNPNFTSAATWNLNSNWSISGGTCNADGTSNNDINQNTVLGVVGQKYRITYVISAYTQGSISARIGSGVTAYNTGTGTFTQVVTATTTDRIRMNIASNFIGSVDSLSIVKVTEEDASYADMCMQTGSSTYEWVNIVRNTY